MADCYMGHTGGMIANLQWFNMQGRREEVEHFRFLYQLIFLSTIEVEVVEDLKGWTSFGRTGNTTINPQGNNHNQGTRNATIP